MRDGEREQGEASRSHVHRRETGAASYKRAWRKRGSSKIPGHAGVICHSSLGERPFLFDILVPSSVS